MGENDQGPLCVGGLPCHDLEHGEIERGGDVLNDHRRVRWQSSEFVLGQPQWAVTMAVSTVATLPVALLFIFFQRYFITGLTMSGIKG